MTDRLWPVLIGLSRFALWSAFWFGLSVGVFLAIVEIDLAWPMGDRGAEMIDQLIISGGLAPLVPIFWGVLMVSTFFAGLFDFPKFRPFFRFDRGVLAALIVIACPIVFFELWRAIELRSFFRPGVVNYPTFIGDLEPTARVIAEGSGHLLVAWCLLAFNWWFPAGPRRSLPGLLYRYSLPTVVLPLIYVSWWYAAYRLGQHPIVEPPSP